MYRVVNKFEYDIASIIYHVYFLARAINVPFGHLSTSRRLQVIDRAAKYVYSSKMCFAGIFLDIGKIQ
jgi:hypothetical protein